VVATDRPAYQRIRPADARVWKPIVSGVATSLVAILRRGGMKPLLTPPNSGIVCSLVRPR
jgi:hypothetical protein